MATMTKREEHANNLAYIAEYTGTYNRKFTFKEADDFINTMEAYHDEFSYPWDLCIQYAYDHYFIDRGVTFKRRLINA